MITSTIQTFIVLYCKVTASSNVSSPKKRIAESTESSETSNLNKRVQKSKTFFSFDEMSNIPSTSRLYTNYPIFNNTYEINNGQHKKEEHTESSELPLCYNLYNQDTSTADIKVINKPSSIVNNCNIPVSGPYNVLQTESTTQQTENIMEDLNECCIPTLTANTEDATAKKGNSKEDHEAVDMTLPFQDVKSNYAQGISSSTLSPQNIYECNSLCNGFNIDQYANKYIESCVNSTAFVETALHLIKDVIYYRFNILKFFSNFHNQAHYVRKGNKNLHPENITASMKRLIDLFVEYASTESNKLNDSGNDAQDYNYKKVKLNEKWLEDECAKKTDLKSLSNSYEFKSIKEFNKYYLIATTVLMKNTTFRTLHSFLSPFFSHNCPLSKYYHMLCAVLKSVQHFSEYIDQRLDKEAQDYLLDLNLFDVRLCCCSRETKQNFVFHWVFCWISYFSNSPFFKIANHYDPLLHPTINFYPKEFFLQIIVLAHCVTNLGTEKVTVKDIDSKSIKMFEVKAFELLFNNFNDSTESLYQSILQNLFISSKDIFNQKITLNNTVKKAKVIQNLNENIQLSNKLIPTLQDILDIVCYVAKLSYASTKTIISEEK